MSSGAACSSELEDVAAPPASPSVLASPLALCFRGRSILKVMAVEVQYSSNPYKYLNEKNSQMAAPDPGGHGEGGAPAYLR